jgi:hypothetical protein
MPSKAETVATLMTVSLVVGMTGPLIAAQVARAKELQNRALCAGNLREIARAVMVYAADNDDVFPVTPGVSAQKYTAAFKPDLIPGKAGDALASYYGKAAKQSGDVTANLWMTVLAGDIAKPAHFVCASDPFAGDAAPLVDDPKAPKAYYNNFGKGTALSYSMIYPWVKKDGAVAVSPAWKSVCDSSLPIMADMAPYLVTEKGKGDLTVTRGTAGAAATPLTTREADKASDAGRRETPLSFGIYDSSGDEKVNSVNHGGQGQNVAFSDGHAEWARTPDVGAGGDNIWTLKVGGEHRVPKTGDLSVAHQLSGTVDDTDWDVVMVPTRDAKGGVH